MVRLNSPLFSQSASKQLGKILVYKTKGGRGFLTKYSKPSSVRKTEPSLLQLEKRTIYGEATEYWRSLSNSQKNVYNETAKEKHYSGFNLFIKEWFELHPSLNTYAYYGTRIYGYYIYANQE